MIVIVLCILISTSGLQAQAGIKEPPTFDKKFLALSGILIGSTIWQVETTARNRPVSRGSLYTIYGISDLLLISTSANQKFEGKKWWWVMPTSVIVFNGGLVIKYSRKF